LGIPGCHWFSYASEGDCKLCKEWFGDQVGVSGCRDWTPKDYCQKQIFEAAQHRWGRNPADPSFVEAIQRYRITLGSGEAGNPWVKRLQCNLWCDSFPPIPCYGQPRVLDEVKGVNYGGRFIPEAYLHLSGNDELFEGVNPAVIEVDGSAIREPSLCDVGTQPDAGARMAKFLDTNIKREHFQRIAASGFNVVRLPLGYWNLIEVPFSAGPNSPVGERWRSLQSIMPPANYSRWIHQVFSHAKEYNLRVLLDLHAAPGGQSGNQFTGCDQGAGNHYFITKWNLHLAVGAVERMAQICGQYGFHCFGIELLNEPHSGISRSFLKEYYYKSIEKARQHIIKNKPLIIMDWTRWLGWWQKERAFTYAKHGRIMFATHVYGADGVTDQLDVRSRLSSDMEAISEFFTQSEHSIFVSEYALSGHGTGELCKDPFDYHSLANWFVHQFNQFGAGSVVWNFDAATTERPWGPVATRRLGSGEVEWKQILGSDTTADRGLGHKFCSGNPEGLPVMMAAAAALRAGPGGARPEVRQEVARACAWAAGLGACAGLLLLALRLGPRKRALAWGRPEPLQRPGRREAEEGGMVLDAERQLLNS